jgi:tetratricopeptide (TPR) repeat protein
MKRFHLLNQTLSLFVLLSLFNYQAISAQKKDGKENYLTIDGVVDKGEDNPIEGATVKLFEKGNLVNSITTGKDGMFNFKLGVNSEFLLEVSMTGMVTKLFNVNTTVPEYEKGIWDRAFSVTLFEPCAGVDMSLLQSPVFKLVYNSLNREFLPEKNYDKVMVDKLQQLTKKNDDCIEEQYNSIVRKADRQLAEKKYNDAVETYKIALGKRPKDEYVKGKIAEIEKILSNQKKNEKLYDDYIAQADKQFSNKSYVLSKEFYKRALGLKPDEDYPKSQMAAIDKLLADKNQQEQEKSSQEANFQQLIAQGNAAYNSDVCGKALQSYRDALVIKPGDQVLLQKISETEKKCKETQKKDSDNKALRDQYDKEIAEADKLFVAKDYSNARTGYENASQLITTEPYPKQKIKDIDDILKSKDKEKESQYKNLISLGDKAYDSEDFLKAKDNFQKALVIKPNEKYPTDKIKEIDNILAEQQKLVTDKKAKQELYNKAIADADLAFKTPNYEAAKAGYKKALQILPSESYPKQKLAEIDGILKDMADKTDNDYNAKIHSGDQNFGTKNYVQAKQDYQDALKIKPNQEYPVSKIADIDKILAEQSRLTAEQKAKRDAYNIALAKADNLFKATQYDQALLSYKEASTYLPEEKYPYTQIDEINKMKKQQDLESNYKKAIASADVYFKNKQWESSKSFYNQALNFKQNDPYATEQIKKADQEIGNMLKLLADQKARQDAYDKAIADADKSFTAKDYDMSLTSYQTALAIFSDKPYPKQRIEDINKLQKQKKLDSDYRSLLDEANQLFAGKNYENARAKYVDAGLLKPDEVFPQEKIKEIDKILSQTLADTQKKEANEKLYNTTLSNANALFDKARYDDAKKEYEKALAIMPNEGFSKQRIAKINDIKNLLAKDAKQSSNAASEKAAPQKESKVSELKFKNDTEREAYLKDLLAKYPEGITCEVYKEKNRTVTRYIIIRDNKANDFREVRYNWGGVDMYHNDKPVTSLYFNSQVKKRENEFYNKTEQ